MTLPKVLIIGQPFEKTTGGGITLTNLFKDWNRDKIAVACSGYLLNGNIDLAICNTYYQLGHKEHKFVFPFNLLKRKYPSGLVKFKESKIHDLTVPKTRRLRVKVIMNYFYPFLKYLGMDHCISKTKLSEDFCNWVKKYNPDIIYLQASSREEVLFYIAVQNYVKKPIIFHMMDDWPEMIGNIGLLKKFWYKKIDREFRILLDKATLLMSISDYMSHEYKKRYDKNFVVFHNPIDIEFWKKHQKIDYKLGDSPTILYGGKIGFGMTTSLEKIAKAIQSINKDRNVPIKFDMRIKENPSWINNYSCVEKKSFVSHIDLPKVFSEADFLILPFDFSWESIKYVQYSMPTKIPEYMISGTPIIIFAPEVTAVVKYAKEFKWAKLVTVNSVNELSKAIIQLIQDKEERQRIGQNAERIAEDRYNSIKVRNDFRTLISSL